MRAVKSFCTFLLYLAVLLCWLHAVVACSPVVRVGAGGNPAARGSQSLQGGIHVED